MRCVILPLLLLAANSLENAKAHSGHDMRLKIVESDGLIRVQTSIDVGQILQFDDDKNGELSAEEFTRHSNDIAEWVDARIGVIRNNNFRLQPIFTDIPVEHFSTLEAMDPISRVKIIRHYKIPDEQSALLIHFDLFGAGQNQKPYVIWRGGVATRGILHKEVSTIPLP